MKGNSPWQDKKNQGEQEGKTKKKGSKTGVEFLGLSGREIRVKLLGAVNHRPNFFAQISRQMSRKIPRPEKFFFAHSFVPEFAPVLAQPASFPLRSLSAFETPRNRSSLEAQTSQNTARLSLCAIPWRLATIACVIKMKDRGREQCSQNRSFRRTVLGSSRGPCYHRDAKNFLLIGCLLIFVNCPLIILSIVC